MKRQGLYLHAKYQLINLKIVHENPEILFLQIFKFITVFCTFYMSCKTHVNPSQTSSSVENIDEFQLLRPKQVKTRKNPAHPFMLWRLKCDCYFFQILLRLNLWDEWRLLDFYFLSFIFIEIYYNLWYNHWCAAIQNIKLKVWRPVLFSSEWSENGPVS